MAISMVKALPLLRLLEATAVAHGPKQRLRAIPARIAAAIAMLRGIRQQQQRQLGRAFHPAVVAEGRWLAEAELLPLQPRRSLPPRSHRHPRHRRLPRGELLQQHLALVWGRSALGLQHQHLSLPLRLAVLALLALLLLQDFPHRPALCLHLPLQPPLHPHRCLGCLTSATSSSTTNTTMVMVVMVILVVMGLRALRTAWTALPARLAASAPLLPP